MQQKRKFPVIFFHLTHRSTVTIAVDVEMKAKFVVAAAEFIKLELDDCK